MNSFWKIGLIPVAVSLLISTAQAQLLRTVALTGDDAPGTESGVKFSNVNWPVLNSAGKVAFVASLASTELFRDSGIWSEGNGALALVARRGDRAPGTPDGVNFDIFGDVQMNSSGRMEFYSGLRGTGVFTFNNNGLWSDGSGPLGLVVRSGNPAPGTPAGVNFAPNLYYEAWNSAGRSAFYGQLTGSGVTTANDGGIWSDGPLSLVAREGSQAPGFASGVNYSVLGTPLLNSAGQLVFYGSVAGPGVTTANDEIFWSNRSGTLAPIVRAGSPAPGTSSGVNFLDLIGGINLNAAGRIALVSHLAGSGVNTSNDMGIWSEGSGPMSLVARKGNHAPGTLAGVNFGEFDLPVLNNAGKTAFRATLTGTGVLTANRQGIWSEGFGAQHLVVRSGDQAPGTPDGITFGSVLAPVFNSAGQTAFSAFLRGDGIDTPNNFGIWAEGRDGVVRLVARTGDLLEVSPGDFRTIKYLAFRYDSNNDNGLASGFNDIGQLAFLAEFADGSEGVFVSSVATIPEPSTMGLCGVVAGVMLRCRRFQRRGHSYAV